jgi:hypothetical protein
MQHQGKSETEKARKIRARRFDKQREPEKEHVEDLKRSRKLVGEIDAVVKDQFGRIIAGRHRSAAGWKTKRVLESKDNLDYLVKRLHSTVQRHSTLEEQSQMFRAICEEIEKQGKIPKEKIGHYVLTHISPYKQTYTQDLIPDEFKQQSKQRFENNGNTKSFSKNPDISSFKIGGVTFVKKPLEEEEEHARHFGVSSTTLTEEAPERRRECPCGFCPPHTLLLVTQDYMVLRAPLELNSQIGGI